MNEVGPKNDDIGANLVPQTRELKTHNHLLNNRDALDEAFERDGYWFFREVLDKGAVGRLRQVYIRELEKQGVIDPVGTAPTDRSVPYNGVSLDGFPPHMEPLDEGESWKSFVAEKPIHDFFANVLDDEPVWLPIVEYRATPPAQDHVRRLSGIHQDGSTIVGIPFRICWVPLAEIDAKTGGIIFAGGHAQRVHRAPIQPDGSRVYIPLNYLPEDCWYHTTYGAGDLLMLHPWTPHSGMTNLSDRFRLSIDVRVMKKHGRLPVVGEVASIAVDRIEVRDSNGVTSFRIDADTYVRNQGAQGARKLSGEGILQYFPPGSPVIVGHDGRGLATVVRPPAGCASGTPSLFYPAHSFCRESRPG